MQSSVRQGLDTGAARRRCRIGASQGERDGRGSDRVRLSAQGRQATVMIGIAPAVDASHRRHAHRRYRHRRRDHRSGPSMTAVRGHSSHVGRRDRVARRHPHRRARHARCACGVAGDSDRARHRRRRGHRHWEPVHREQPGQRGDRDGDIREYPQPRDATDPHVCASHRPHYIRMSVRTCSLAGMRVDRSSLSGRLHGYSVE